MNPDTTKRDWEEEFTRRWNLTSDEPDSFFYSDPSSVTMTLDKEAIKQFIRTLLQEQSKPALRLPEEMEYTRNPSDFRFPTGI